MSSIYPQNKMFAVNSIDVGLWASHGDDLEQCSQQFDAIGFRTVVCNKTSFSPTALPPVVFAALPSTEIQDISISLEKLAEDLPLSMPVLVSVYEQDLQSVLHLANVPSRGFIVRGASVWEAVFRMGALRRLLENNNFSSLKTEFDDYVFDCVQSKVYFRGITARLTRSEFAMALYLFNHPNTPVERGTLYKLYASGRPYENRRVDAIICKLKAKLLLTSQNGAIITSLHKIGYQLNFTSSDSIH